MSQMCPGTGMRDIMPNRTIFFRAEPMLMLDSPAHRQPGRTDSPGPGCVLYAWSASHTVAYRARRERTVRDEFPVRPVALGRSLESRQPGGWWTNDGRS